MDVVLDSCGRRGVRPLLLIYLLVVQAAADCLKPGGRENTVLTDEALLMNDFPESSVASLECANGYVRESGSGSITCVDGGWTEPDLVCIKRDCGPPRPQPNMSFNTSSGTLFGAVAEVVCDKGYQISGASYKQCYASGWSGRAKCKIVTCDKPAEVTNGKSSWVSEDNPTYESIIFYTCNEGYTLIGKGRIECSETGKYDSQPPECRSVTRDDRVTPNMITSTPPAQGGKNVLTAVITEASTSTDSSGTPRPHRDKTLTTSATPTVSPSVQGGRGILTAEDKATTAGVTSISTSLQDKHEGVIDTSKDIAYTPVIVSVVCVSLAACIVVGFLHKFLLRRKGSANGTMPIC